MSTHVDDGRALVSRLGLDGPQGITKLTLVFAVDEVPIVITEGFSRTSSAELGEEIVRRYKLVPFEPEGEVGAG